MILGFELDKLCATSEIGFQPRQRDISDSNGGQSVQEDVMRDSVEECTEELALKNWH